MLYKLVVKVVGTDELVSPRKIVLKEKVAKNAKEIPKEIPEGIPKDKLKILAYLLKRI